VSRNNPSSPSFCGRFKANNLKKYCSNKKIRMLRSNIILLFYCRIFTRKFYVSWCFLEDTSFFFSAPLPDFPSPLREFGTFTFYFPYKFGPVDVANYCKSSRFKAPPTRENPAA